ncbi:hypothetical protein GCM10028821_11000 [Hymenobacter jeollabukensis]
MEARAAAPGGPPAYSPFGWDLTPRGDLRILVIFAGISDDIAAGAMDYAPNSDTPWPQYEATNQTPGTAFPRNF